MKTFFGLALISMLALGQDAPPKRVQKLIQLKYADADQVHNLLRSYGTRDSTMDADRRMRVLAISGSAEYVSVIEDAVKKLDVAPIDFDLNVYLVSSAASDSLPSVLASTGKQLHSVFSYAGYQLLEDFVLRGRDGIGAASSGTFHGTHSTYTFRYQQATVSTDSPKTISLHGLDLNLRTPTGALNKEGQQVTQGNGLSTDIDVREGQKVVVGKSDIRNGDSPLIVVVTAKVVE